MRTLIVAALVAFVVPDRPDPSPRSETPPLQQQLIGEWVLVKNIVSGSEAPPDGLRMVFTTDALQQVNDRDGVRAPLGSYKYILDATRTPARISFPQTKYEGIVKIEGETLTICFAAVGSTEPPTQFASGPNSNTIILQATRVVKK